MSNEIGNEALRVGVLLDSDHIPAWACEMLESIRASDFASLELVVYDDSDTAAKPLLRRIVDNRSRLLYLAYRGLSNRLAGSRAPSLQMQDANSLLEGVDAMSVKPERSGFVDRFADDDIKRIAGYELDVIVRLGFRILKGEILTTPQHGVWSLHHGDNRVNRGMPPGFWEVLESWPESGAVLQILSEDLDGGKILYRSNSLTMHPFVEQNLEAYNWKAMLFVPRMLKRLQRLGPDRFFAEVDDANAHPSFYSRRLYKAPDNWHMLKLLTRYGLGYVRRKIRSLFFVEQWQLFFARNRKENEPELSLRNFVRLAPPKERFWADPHVVDRDGSSYIFFEDLPFATGKGHISVVSIDEDGSVSAPTIALERPYHLSYPHVLEVDGKLYMIPETMENGTIELYECTQFPHRWEFVMNLMEDVRAVDATVLHRDGRWWLFANVAEHPGVSVLDELFVFYADTFPTNEWQAHSANPVVTDVSRARPAGPLFECRGELYRPSQNSSGRYGKSINIQHVVELTEHSYQERAVSEITPDWSDDLIGTHTLAVSNELTVVDAEVLRWRFPR